MAGGLICFTALSPLPEVTSGRATDCRQIPVTRTSRQGGATEAPDVSSTGSQGPWGQTRECEFESGPPPRGGCLTRPGPAASPEPRGSRPAPASVPHSPTSPPPPGHAGLAGRRAGRALASERTTAAPGSALPKRPVPASFRFQSPGFTSTALYTNYPNLRQLTARSSSLFLRPRTRTQPQRGPDSRRPRDGWPGNGSAH